MLGSSWKLLLWHSCEEWKANPLEWSQAKKWEGAAAPRFFLPFCCSWSWVSATGPGFCPLSYYLALSRASSLVYPLGFVSAWVCYGALPPFSFPATQGETSLTFQPIVIPQLCPLLTLQKRRKSKSPAVVVPTSGSCCQWKPVGPVASTSKHCLCRSDGSGPGTSGNSDCQPGPQQKAQSSPPSQSQN